MELDEFAREVDAWFRSNAPRGWRAAARAMSAEA